MSELPDGAVRAVARIEAMLDEANRLIARGGLADESAFAVRETETRYLRDTLDSYLRIPTYLRDAAAEAALMDQLGLLERATAARLGELGDSGRSALSANGAFLAERFAADAGAPAVPADAMGTFPAVPRTLVARFFSDLDGPVRSDPAALLQLAAQRFAAAFPGLTTVKRGLFGGGAVKSVALDIPIGADVLRYTLEAERGGVAAACTKIVRGVALRTERTDPASWLQALFEDVNAYVERDRSARDLLTSFLHG